MKTKNLKVSKNSNSYLQGLGSQFEKHCFKAPLKPTDPGKFVLSLP